MSKSQSKSKNPFHSCQPSPPMLNFQIKITRYFNLTLATHSIALSMKNRLSYVKFEAFRVLSSLATSKNR